MFFTSLLHLLTLIREAKTEKTQQRLEMGVERFDLIVNNQLGYTDWNEEGAEMRFNHISLRTKKTAAIITPF